MPKRLCKAFRGTTGHERSPSNTLVENAARAALDLPECEERVTPQRLDFDALFDRRGPMEIYRRARKMGFGGAPTIKRNEPRLYRTVLCLLANGVPMYRIAEMTRLAPSTISRILTQEAGTINAIRQKIGEGLLSMGLMGVEKAFEALARINPENAREFRDMMVALGVAIENGLACTSSAGAVHANLSGTGPTHADYLHTLKMLTPVEGEVSPPLPAESAPHPKGD